MKYVNNDIKEDELIFLDDCEVVFEPLLHLEVTFYLKGYLFCLWKQGSLPLKVYRLIIKKSIN